jgi:hypothetical protein
MHRLLRVDSRRTLACTRPDHIEEHAARGSRCARPPGPCTRQLHPKSKIRSLSFQEFTIQPTPARALHCSNSPAHTTLVCFERATTEVENDTTGPPSEWLHSHSHTPHHSGLRLSTHTGLNARGRTDRETQRDRALCSVAFVVERLSGTTASVSRRLSARAARVSHFRASALRARGRR